MNFSLFNKVFFIILFFVTTAQAETNNKIIKIQNTKSENDLELIYKIVIENQALDGFAYYKFTIPTGYKLENYSIDNCIITQKDTTIKLMWLDLKDSKHSYTIKLHKEEASDSIANFVQNHKFKYVYNQVAKEIFKSTNETQIELIDTITKPQTVHYISNFYNKNQIKFIKQNKDLKLEPTYSSNIISKNISFKVQIASSKKRLNAIALSKIYTGNLKINEELYPNGWYKYTIGNFATYEEAELLRLNTNIEDAIVTAHCLGQRINLLEAIKQTNNSPYKQVIFKVQIAAHAKELSKSKLAKLYKLKESISIEKNQGIYKYTIGEFFSYNEAQKFKKELHIVDAFLVAYKNGERIDIKLVRDQN